MKNNKISLNRKNIFEIIAMTIIVILVSLMAIYFIKDRDEKNILIYDKNIDKFVEQYNYILDNYYGDIDKEQLITNAIEGMLNSLDDYSGFLDLESNNLSISLTGSYEGVGIGINNNLNGDIIITQVYDDTPASKAGLKYGDVITKLNGEQLIDMDSSLLVKEIAKFSDVNLTILREGKTFDVNLKKEKIELKSVYYEMEENNIGYIYINIFALNTYTQFKNALQTLENMGMKYLIVDLRNNSGGHLSAVENMLSLFLDGGNIIYQTEDKNGIEKVYSSGNITKTYPIVILQNGSSASASEMMAISLKENLNAYIIGKTSYGKGTVQGVKDFNNELQYKFTTKRWLTPLGNSINGIGIKPDLEIELDMNTSIDNQYQAALDYIDSLN